MVAEEARGGGGAEDAGGGDEEEQVEGVCSQLGGGRLYSWVQFWSDSVRDFIVHTGWRCVIKDEL